MQKVIFTLILSFCFCLVSFGQVIENKNTDTSSSENKLDELNLDSQNTLETIIVTELRNRKPGIGLICFRNGSQQKKMPIYPTNVVHTYIEENFAQLVPITLRNKPGPAEKDPGKPIKELNLYPNPSFGQIQIELVSIDLGDLPSGTYALQLRHEEGTDIQKVIILGD